jgi:Lon protease-like protein
MAEPVVLPMFPLGMTMFPTQLLPLHVFEERYRQMMDDVLSLESDQRFGVSLIERGHEVGGGDSRSAVATTVELVQAEEFDDGRWGIVTAGIERIDIVEWLDDDPYPRALVSRRERIDDGGDLAPVEALLSTAFELTERLSGQPGQDLAALSTDPSTRLDQLSALAPLATFDRQSVLEASTTSAQIAVLSEALDLRIMLLQAELDN